MRRLAVLLAVVALVSCKDKAPVQKDGIQPDLAASATAVDGLTIVPKMPAVGTKWEETRKNQMKLTMTVDIGAARNHATLDDRETTVEKSEVLGVEGKIVTKKKITYAEKTKVQSENGKDKSTPSPLVGKTYVLAMVDGKPAVTDEAGKSVPAVEEELVLKSHRSFGKPDPMFDGMPQGAIRVGDEVPSLKKALQDNLADSDDGKDHPEFIVDSVKLTTIDKGNDLVGVFALEITVQTPKDSKDPFAMKAKLTGTMKLRAKDGWLTGMELKGPLDLAGKDPSFKVEGKGDMNMQFANAY